MEPHLVASLVLLLRAVSVRRVAFLPQHIPGSIRGRDRAAENVVVVVGGLFERCGTPRYKNEEHREANAQQLVHLVPLFRPWIPTALAFSRRSSESAGAPGRR